MTKFIKTKAIVLKRTNFGEADRIIQFLTPQGQISVMAKGVRRAKSKLAGGLELFSVSDLVLIKGKNDFYRLTSARLDKYFEHIIKDYDRMELAYFVLKEIYYLSRDIDDQSWWLILVQILRGLDVGLDPKLIKLWFIIQSREVAGEGLNLRSDVNGQDLKPDQNYNYDHQQQAFYQNKRGPINKNHIKIMRLMSEHQLLVVNQIKDVKEFLDPIEKILKIKNSD